MPYTAFCNHCGWWSSDAHFAWRRRKAGNQDRWPGFVLGGWCPVRSTGDCRGGLIVPLDKLAVAGLHLYSCHRGMGIAGTCWLHWLQINGVLD